MSAKIAVASPLLTSVGVRLTGAQRAALWELAAILDERRIAPPADPSRGEAVWVQMPSKRLRGRWGRDDNIWLKELLRRLEGVRLGGRAGTDAWGGVLIAQWRISDGGRIVEVLIPPGGLAALRSPATFARVSVEAAHRLPPHARALYGLLADRQRQTVPRWRVSLADLRVRLGLAEDAYRRWSNLRRRVLDPAVVAINAARILSLGYAPEYLGRRIEAITFSWATIANEGPDKASPEITTRPKLPRQDPSPSPSAIAFRAYMAGRRKESQT